MPTHLQRMEIMSIWEVGHRWAGHDPDKTDEKNLPDAVSEKIREVLQATENTLNILDINGDELLDSAPLLAYIPYLSHRIPWDVIPNSTSKRIQELMLLRQYPKDALNSVFIRKSEFEEYWRHKVGPLPFFWFSPGDIEYHEQRKPDIYKDTYENRVAEGLIESDTTPEQEPETSTPISELARKAANARHKPLNEIKTRFVDFYEASQDDYKSIAAACRAFYRSLSQEEQRILNPSNDIEKAVRTLREHLKSTKYQQ